MNLVTLSHVSKHFGQQSVLNNLDLTIPEHEIYGLIGQNGAGKTTTMRLILGLLKPDSGEIIVNNERVTFGQNKTNQYIGYLPDVPEFYGYLTSREYMRLCGQITGMDSAEIISRSEELLDLVGLADINQRIQTFSRGMKQRLGIAQALLNRPKLLICDEPTSALDPLGRKEILDILVSVKQQTTILFSTHILSDVDRICDRIALLNDGKLVLQGSLAEIKALNPETGFELVFAHPTDCQSFMVEFPTYEIQSPTKVVLAAGTETDFQAALAFISAHQFPMQRFEKREPTLEDLFMEVVSK